MLARPRNAWQIAGTLLRHLPLFMFALAACGGSDGSGVSAGGAGAPAEPDPTAGAAPSGPANGSDAGSSADAGCTACASELVTSDPQGDILGAAPSFYLAVDETSVYVARSDYVPDVDDVRIARAPKAGGSLNRYATSDDGAVTALAVSASYLFYVRHTVDGAYLTKMPKNGGAPVTVFTWTGSSRYTNLLVDGSSLWFTASMSIDPAKIYKADVTTNVVTPIFDGGSVLAMNATHLFWTKDDGAMMKAPKDKSGAPAAIATVERYPEVPWSIVADGDDVYSGAESRIELTRVGASLPYAKKALNAPVPLSNPTLMAMPSYVDDAWVYLAASTSMGSGVYRVARSGGAPTLFAIDDEALAITGDATHVYWTNRAREVRRKAK